MRSTAVADRVTKSESTELLLACALSVFPASLRASAGVVRDGSQASGDSCATEPPLAAA
jgi:hypothetical protein